MGKNSRVRLHKKSNRKTYLLLLLLCLVGFLGWGVASNNPFFHHLISLFSIPSEAEKADLAARGKIYDRNFKELASSLENVSVYAIPREIEDNQSLSLQLASVLEADQQDLSRALQSDAHRVLLAKNIDQQEEEYIRQQKLPGIILNRQISRYYPEHETAAHVVGISDGKVGLTGVEFYHDQLRDEISTSITGKELLRQHAALQPSSKYKNIVLTLDLKVQRILEEFVADLGKKRPGTKIAACLMEGDSGAIISAVNHPSFDPNYFKDYSPEDLSNLLLDPIVIPSSFRKVLRDAVSVNSSGRSDNAFLPWSISANRMSLGAELRMWGPLGLESQTKVDFGVGLKQDKSAEVCATPVERQYDNSTVPVYASPLQLLSAFTSLINGGKPIRPHTVQKIVDNDGESELFIGPQNSPSQVVEKRASSEISRLFLAGAQAGKLNGMYLTGKSGFFARSQNGMKYSGNQVVVAPFPFDKPEIVFLLVVQDNNFTPADRQVMRLKNYRLVEKIENVIPSLAAVQQVMKNLADVVQVGESQEMNLPLRQGGTSDNIIQLAKKHQEDDCIMPDLIGQSLRKSLRMLDEWNVEVRVKGSGVVLQQSPGPGEKLPEGTVCTVSLGPKELNMLQ